MKVGELIEKLKEFDPNKEVKVFSWRVEVVNEVEDVYEEIGDVFLEIGYGERQLIEDVIESNLREGIASSAEVLKYIKDRWVMLPEVEKLSRIQKELEE